MMNTRFETWKATKLNISPNQKKLTYIDFGKIRIKVNTNYQKAFKSLRFFADRSYSIYLDSIAVPKFAMVYRFQLIEIDLFLVCFQNLYFFKSHERSQYSYRGLSQGRI